MRVFFSLILLSALLGVLEGHGQGKPGGRNIWKHKHSKGGMKWHPAVNEEECGKTEATIEGYPKDACSNLKKDDKLCMCMSRDSENWNFICGKCSMTWIGDFKGLYKKKMNKQNRKWSRGGSGRPGGLQNDAAAGSGGETDEERNTRWRAFKANRDQRGKKVGNQDRFNNRQKLRQKMKQNQKQKGGQGRRDQEGRRQEGSRRPHKGGRGQNNKNRNKDGRKRNEVEVKETVSVTATKATSKKPAPTKATSTKATSTKATPVKAPRAETSSIPNKSATKPTPNESTPKESTPKPTPSRRRRRDAKK